MKFKQPLLVLCSLVIASCAMGQVTLPFYDGFNYTTATNLAAQGNWVSASGSGTIKIGSANLPYSALTNGGGKNVTIIPSGTAARTYVNFASQTSGSVYFSFLLKLNSLPTSQSIIGFASPSTSSDTTPSLGFFVKQTTGQFAVGINTSTPQFSSANLTIGQVYLIVVGYTFGASDTAEIWIDPASLGGSAPAATGSFTGTHNTSLANFLWNTASSGGGSFEVDEFRIGSTYASVTPPSSAVQPPPTTNSTPRITQTLLSSGNIILRGTNGTASAAFEILASTNPALPVAQWSVIGSNSFNASGNFDTTNPITPLAAQRYFRLRVGSSTNVSSPAVAPSITSQPQNQSAAVGQGALLSVTASGTAPLSYQWYFNTNTPLLDATNATHTISSVSSNDVGTYSVVVTNAAGSTNSFFATLTISPPPTNGDFFVSTTGNDSNPGTLASPFASVAKALSVVGPGQTIYLRGGTYFPSQTMNITNSGTPGNLTKLWAYPGELPVLDFVNQPYGSANRGFVLKTNGSYWHFKGLEIARAGDNAIKVESSGNIFELLVLHNNGDTGLQIGFAHETANDGSMGASNLVLNCDSYLNYDSDNRGSDADGFACKLHPGRGNVFIGCRSWENSDDGWDLFESDHTIIISNCWTFHAGDASKYNVVGGSFQGNGNGFKLGGNGAGGSSEGTHYVYNCVSFNNSFPGRTAHGFDQNSHHGGTVLYNCLSWSNQYNFFFEDSAGSNPAIFQNNISFTPSANTSAGTGVSSFGSGAVVDHNSWQLAVTANASDFNALTEAAAKAPRNPDGSLPNGFARLVNGSDLIDKGVDVGIPFNGNSPDLGPYESP